MRIDSSGNVGIGTASPSAQLHVKNNDAGFEVDVDGQVTDGVRLLAYDRNTSTDRNIQYRANKHLFNIGSSERMRIDSSGNVGIGATSPARKLTVQGGSGDNLPVRVVGGSGTTKSHMEFQDASTTADYKVTLGSVGDGMSFQAGGSERMRIASSGKVGIGTTNPDAKIEIVGNGTTVKVSNSAVSSTNTAIQLGGYAASNNSAYGAHIRAYHNFGVGSASSLVFETSGTQERMRIDSSGNVGIGTASPDNVGSSKTLHINDNTNGGAIRLSEGNTNNAFVSYDDSNGMRIQSIDTIALKTGNTERMRIDSSGNLLVGKTAASTTNTVGHELDVDGHAEHVINGTTTANALMLNRKNTDGGLIDFRKDNTTVGSINTVNGDMYLGTANVNLRFTDSANDIRPVNSSGVNLDNTVDLGASATRFKDLYLSGNSYVGATSTTDTKGVVIRGGSVGFTQHNHADGTASGNYYSVFRYNTSTIGSITQSGTTGVAYNTTSDERLKENIQDAEDAGSKIDGMRIRQFDWKSDGSHQDYGVVAQELVTVAPEAVHQPEDEDEMMSVDYSKLVPTLIKEIQTLRNRVAQLENN
jgi:hypothetical protein